MKTLWQQIETWLSHNNPELMADLNPGASEQEIEELEQLTGLSLPDSFKDVWREHNGQRGMADYLFGTWQFMSLKHIGNEWKLMKKLYEQGKLTGECRTEGPVKPVWWSLSWFPFGYSGAGDFICLDYDPASGGVEAQVITFWHADDLRTCLASSFESWFKNFAQGLASGRMD